jgi:peptidoglycan hydrolase-like protein with peptidoglycan-binding domain
MPNAPLSVGAYGPSVARLHSLLRQKGFTLPTSEVNRSFFGPITRQAVQEFQKRVGLPVTGGVDERTESGLGTVGTIAESPTPQSIQQQTPTTVVTPPVAGQAAMAGPGKVESGTDAGTKSNLNVTLPVATLSDLAGALPDKSVWENLQTNTPAKSFLINALNQALKVTVSETLSSAKKPTLAGAVEAHAAPTVLFGQIDSGSSAFHADGSSVVNGYWFFLRPIRID